MYLSIVLTLNLRRAAQTKRILANLAASAAGSCGVSEALCFVAQHVDKHSLDTAVALQPTEW